MDERRYRYLTRSELASLFIDCLLAGAQPNPSRRHVVTLSDAVLDDVLAEFRHRLWEDQQHDGQLSLPPPFPV